MSVLKESHPDVLKTEILAAKGNPEILFDLQPKAYNLLLEAFRNKAASHDPLKRLEEICKTYLHFGLENPETYKLMFTSIKDADGGTVKLHDENDIKVFNYFTDCLDRCTRRELIRFKTNEIGALQIWSMMHGLVSLHIQSRISVIGISDHLVASTLNKTIDDFLESIKR